MKLPDTLEVRCAGAAGRGIFAVAWQGDRYPTISLKLNQAQMEPLSSELSNTRGRAIPESQVNLIIVLMVQKSQTTTVWMCKTRRK